MEFVDNFLNLASLQQVYPLLLEGLAVTLKLIAVIVPTAILVGLLIAILGDFRIPILQWLTVAYVDFFRAFPPLVLLVFLYSGLPFLGVALVFGVINPTLRPLTKILTFPLILVTLGLFALVVNAGLFLLTGWLANELGLPFHVSGFWPGFWGAIIMSVVSFASQVVLPSTNK